MSTVRELTNRHRAQQLLLAKDTKLSVAKLWPLLDWDALDESYPELAATMATLVRRNRQDSAGLASAYLKQVRRAAGLSDVQRVLLAEFLPTEQFETSLQTTSVIAVKKSIKNRVDRPVALANALTMTQGSMSRLVLNAGRETITRTSAADSRIIGWQRVGNGECDWCSMLLGRGAVYGADTVDFPAHDSCRCSGEPVFA